MLDPQGKITSWNTGAERIKGYQAEEIIGRHFSCFYPSESVQRGWPDEELRRAASDGRFEDEGWRVRKDGGQFWANVIITALRDEAGNLRGLSKITRDLTERRPLERAKLQTEVMADLSRRKDEFVAMLSHELRNPWRRSSTPFRSCSSRRPKIRSNNKPRPSSCVRSSD